MNPSTQELIHEAMAFVMSRRRRCRIAGSVAHCCHPFFFWCKCAFLQPQKPYPTQKQYPSHLAVALEQGSRCTGQMRNLVDQHSLCQGRMSALEEEKRELEIKIAQLGKLFETSDPHTGRGTVVMAAASRNSSRPRSHGKQAICSTCGAAAFNVLRHAQEAWKHEKERPFLEIQQSSRSKEIAAADAGCNPCMLGDGSRGKQE